MGNSYLDKIGLNASNASKDLSLLNENKKNKVLTDFYKNLKSNKNDTRNYFFSQQTNPLLQKQIISKCFHIYTPESEPAKKKQKISNSQIERYTHPKYTQTQVESTITTSVQNKTRTQRSHDENSETSQQNSIQNAVNSIILDQYRLLNESLLLDPMKIQDRKTM